MINVLISLLSAAAVYALSFFLIDAGHVWSLIFGFAVMMALNYLLSKRIMGQVQGIMESAGKVLQGGKFDLAIKTLEGGLKYGKWMFMVKSQIIAQIGIIQFLQKNFSAALPNLEKSPGKNWVGVGMLGVVHMKKKDMEGMIKAFEKGVKANPKEAIMWNIYAYCLSKEGERDKAIEVLNRAVKKLPGDERTASNLKALQNKAKMKMKSFGEIWYQFHLEIPPMSMRVQAGGRGAKGGRKIVRR